jgi:hypothetical protein
MLRESSELNCATQRITRRAGPRCRSGLATGAAAPAIALGVRDYSRTGPWGPIVEKRRLASYDEALFIITTSPLDCPTASARPLLSHPAERRLVAPTATLANRRPIVGAVRQGRALLQAVRRHHR